MKILITFDDDSTYEPEHWAAAWLAPDSWSEQAKILANWDYSRGVMEFQEIALLGYSIERLQEDYDTANVGMAKLYD